jgi:hypothetical protein
MSQRVVDGSATVAFDHPDQGLIFTLVLVVQENP